EAGNTALFLYTGDIGNGWADTQVSVPLPDPIGAGETATIYWRVYEYGPSNNWHMATTDLDVVSGWSSLNAIARVTETSEISMYNSTTYETSDPVYQVELNSWYHYWMTIDYDAGTYSVYVQGPDDASPVAITSTGAATGNFG